MSTNYNINVNTLVDGTENLTSNTVTLSVFEYILPMILTPVQINAVPGAPETIVGTQQSIDPLDSHDIKPKVNLDGSNYVPNSFYVNNSLIPDTDLTIIPNTSVELNYSVPIAPIGLFKIQYSVSGNL